MSEWFKEHVWSVGLLSVGIRWIGESVCIPPKGIQGSKKWMKFYAYILKSQKDGKYYYGSTADFQIDL
jgi:hypothetical protein